VTALQLVVLTINTNKHTLRVDYVINVRSSQVYLTHAIKPGSYYNKVGQLVGQSFAGWDKVRRDLKAFKLMKQVGTGQKREVQGV